MKDQQIDALALYKAYYRFLHEEPRDNAGDICETNPHRINIRHFENMVGIEKENFLGQYGYAKHIGAMAERMRVMVDDPRLGGHYEVMSRRAGRNQPRPLRRTLPPIPRGNAESRPDIRFNTPVRGLDKRGTADHRHRTGCRRAG